jgi:hypothetical protein
VADNIGNDNESDDGDLTVYHKVLDDKEDKRNRRKKNRWSRRNGQ